MMRYLSLTEVLELHRQLIEQSGGSIGIRDLGNLESALAQPGMTFGGEDLYPTVIDKAIALGFSIIMNHPFIDGNKRTGHAAMEIFLILNGMEISASVDEQEQVILAVASGDLRRKAFGEWLRQHTTS
ncbi:MULTISPECIES: type II toxin-antitoxin system death-on-curing family toxin [unclassified Nodularia (in: cyanobacteria)]|uniref:type II toxin-antitoxin system death-on-curing family toxin n=1 Tax=unclassified Nodularia (in: cyanobacteria) TaxID=2656917 RepID=UPI0018802808|nr:MULTISPECIES: type II toxin-antitoxin system death-on-curing family toxin [unclassified Nodularia (in: cyanobacteria)]MBE9199630.1 type II toxin-antitoxin system death-on-curing family toxin [Nodularia sp. LEGE 06071]MCC2695730.1 type II toxin-antitoxin system death-on-curing family toxin [Nodularia sp. LEGE 04288]